MARRMLGEILVEMRAVTPEQIKRALEEQARSETKKKLGEVLIELGSCSADDVTRALAEQHGITMVDLDELDIRPEVIAMVEASHARRYRVVPLEHANNVLTLAAPSPVDLSVLDELRFILERHIRLVLATHDAIERALARYYGREED